MQVIDHDNLEEFRDGDLYDATNSLKQVELEFFSELARKYGGPILDIACGTGRMTIPLAKVGHHLTGVDITSEMLETAKQNTAGLPIEWHHADIRTFKLDKSFNMMFTTGNAFQSFVDKASQEGLLQFAYRHLEDDGVFAFETRNPVLSRLLTDQGKEVEREDGVDENGSRIRHTWVRTYDSVNQLEHYEHTYDTYTTDNKIDRTVTTRIAIRYTFPQELENLLHKNGFVLKERYGHFDKRTFNKDSPLIVCVCRKRK